MKQSLEEENLRRESSIILKSDPDYYTPLFSKEVEEEYRKEKEKINIKRLEKNKYYNHTGEMNELYRKVIVKEEDPFIYINKVGAKITCLEDEVVMRRILAQNISKMSKALKLDCAEKGVIRQIKYL